jgi:hypothetical protein
MAAQAAPDAVPLDDKPLRRPPPPPPTADIPDVEVAATLALPDVASLLVPPGPRIDVGVVPFRTTENVPVTVPVSAPDAPTITITAPPPGIADPPSAPAAIPAPAFVSVVAPRAESIDETRISVRRKAGAHWRLVLPDGRHIEISTTLLAGRDPLANATWPGAALLTIDDEDHSVSKTHAVFSVDAEGLWVTDLDSTNGVIITQPDGTELDLAPNVRCLIQPGADVELGDYIVQVEKD